MDIMYYMFVYCEMWGIQLSLLSPTIPKGYNSVMLLLPFCTLVVLLLQVWAFLQALA